MRARRGCPDAASERRIRERGRGCLAQCDVDAGERARARFARQHEGHRKRIGHRADGVQRLRICAVIRDQQGRRAIGRHLADTVEQASRKAAVVRAQHVGWRPGLCGDAPVAGRRVVHGVVEARGRELAVVAGQGFADRVAVVAVAARRTEHRRERGRIAPATGDRFAPHGQCKLDDRPRAAALDGRQAGGRRQLGWRVRVGRAARKHLGGVRPLRQPRAQHADAFDECTESGHDASPARPKTRLQFVPPKPKALLSAACTRALRSEVT